MFHHEIGQEARALMARLASGEEELHVDASGWVTVRPAIPELDAEVRRLKDLWERAPFVFVRRPGARRAE